MSSLYIYILEYVCVWLLTSKTHTYIFYYFYINHIYLHIDNNSISTENCKDQFQTFWLLDNSQHLTAGQLSFVKQSILRSIVSLLCKQVARGKSWLSSQLVQQQWPTQRNQIYFIYRVFVFTLSQSFFVNFVGIWAESLKDLFCPAIYLFSNCNKSKARCTSL